MPPKTRITREMIVTAAFEVIRREGTESLNARSIAGELGCSTQPVMYHFATMDELRREVYSFADMFHTGYLMELKDEKDPILQIGLNYIRFAVEETRLFRFLFQSGYAAENDISRLMDSEYLVPIISVIAEELRTDMDRAKEVFFTLAMFVHGYASITANNGMVFDEEEASEHLARTFAGAAAAAGLGDRLKGD